jgi:DNA-binding transcriptional LysR family regulator
MNLSDLEAFAAVVESGSIVGAVGRLFLTQSAVTKRNQNMEGALDLILLDRQSRPIRPTPVGKKVYDHARTILASVTAMKEATAHNGEVSGDFNLGVAPGLGEGVVTPLFETLCRHFPKLVPRVFAQNTRVLLERMVSGSGHADGRSCREATLCSGWRHGVSFRPSIDDCGSGTATVGRRHGTLRSSLLSGQNLQESRHAASDHGGDRE